MDTLTPILTWAAPIASTLIITWLTALINRRMDESKKDQEREETERKAWRKSVDERISDVDAKIDVLTEATQTTMRTTLLHYCEKYLTRGWVTPEERASLFDMHDKYSRLNADGITGTVGVDVMSTTGENADGPTVLYKLATPVTTQLDPVELPELSAPNATVFCDGGSATPTFQMEYVKDTNVVIQQLEDIISNLATS